MKFILTFLILFVSAVLSNAQMNKVKEVDFSKIDIFFNQLIDSGKLGGAVTLVAKDDIVLKKAYGYLDVENKIEMKTDVMIPIASMTKIVTSIAILQLQEDGLLALDDPVEKYIPEFAKLKVLVNQDTSITEELKTKPTIKNLLNHTAGMVYSSGETYLDKLYMEAGFRTWDKSLDEYITKVSELPLAYQPGEGWIYSYSHDILGYLVEVVSGKKLSEFCKKRIFDPMELDDMTFIVEKEKAGRLSNLYDYRNEKLYIDDLRDSSIYHSLPNAISGGGGWWSSHGGIVTSIDDFYILSKMLLRYGQYNDAEILDRNSVVLMISNQIGEFDAFGNKYGLGVGVAVSENDPGKTELVFWAGAPYNTYFWIDYKDEIIAILYTNTGPFGHEEMMNQFNVLVEEAIK